MSTNNTTVLPETQMPPSNTWDDGGLGTAWLVVLSFIIATATVGNAVVIYAFCACKKLRERVTNYFVLSLALSDLTTATLAMPFDWSRFLHNGYWRHGAFACEFFTTMYLLAAPGSAINICAVTVDRYVVLKMPLRYKTVMPPRKAIAIIVSLWLYAFVVACLPQMLPRPAGWSEQITNEAMCIFFFPPWYLHMVNFTNFLLPMILVAFFWWRIYLIARRHYKRMKALDKNSHINGDLTSSSRDLCPERKPTKTRRTRRHLKGARFIALAVGLFFLCWLPQVMLGIVYEFCEHCRPGIPSHILYDCFLMLGYLNSALNPFLYPFHDRQYRRAICGIFIKLKANLQRLLSRCGRNAQD